MTFEELSRLGIDWQIHIRDYEDTLQNDTAIVELINLIQSMKFTNRVD